MDTKTPLIPQKQQERPRQKKQERAADVSLPPLTPFPNYRPRVKASWSSNGSKSHPVGSQETLKRRPYKVLQIGATPLMHACQQGDRTRVLKLLKEQSETIGYRDRSLRSALHYCMDAGTGGAVASAAPELVNHPDAEGHTPLHLAVIAGDTQLVAVLLANGADVNAKDLEGHSVLHWATVCGEAECVRLVLASGARPSTPDLRGGSPLHYAAQCCGAAATAELSVPKKVGLKVLQTLLEFGADVNAKDEDGRQPILWAASAGSVEAVLALTRAGGSAAAGASDKDGLTALHCAASRGHARCVEALVNLCGSQPDHVDDNGCSALHYAATLGHADATALLLRLGADPNRQDRKGRTPALCAAAKGQLETLKILATHGGSLHARTIRETGVAHEAVASGCVELVKWLAKKRRSLLDSVTQDGKTPLHVAALHGYLDVCKILLDNGVRINTILKTSKGSLMTALDAALYRGHRDCAKLIQMHGGSTAQHLRSHKTAPSKVFAAKLKVKCADSSTESDTSPRRKSRRHRDPDLYYEERWIERRTRRRKGNSKKLIRQDSRSFSEEELQHSKGHGKRDQPRRALSESARYNNESESEEETSTRRTKSRRYSKKSKHEFSESWTESETSDDEALQSSRKSRPVKKGENTDLEEVSSISDDSLEVVIVKSIEKKSEKVVSGRRSKTPKESYEDRVIRSRRSREKKKHKGSKSERDAIHEREGRKKKSVEIDEASVRKTKEKFREEKDVTDSTSHETIETVTVTAMVHNDQAPDTPKLKEEEGKEEVREKRKEKVEDRKKDKDKEEKEGRKEKGEETEERKEQEEREKKEEGEERVKRREEDEKEKRTKEEGKEKDEEIEEREKRKGKSKERDQEERKEGKDKRREKEEISEEKKRDKEEKRKEKREEEERNQEKSKTDQILKEADAMQRELLTKAAEMGGKDDLEDQEDSETRDNSERKEDAIKKEPKKVKKEQDEGREEVSFQSDEKGSEETSRTTYTSETLSEKSFEDDSKQKILPSEEKEVSKEKTRESSKENDSNKEKDLNKEKDANKEKDSNKEKGPNKKKDVKKETEESLLLKKESAPEISVTKSDSESARKGERQEEKKDSKISKKSDKDESVGKREKKKGIKQPAELKKEDKRKIGLKKSPDVRKIRKESPDGYSSRSPIKTKIQDTDSARGKSEDSARGKSEDSARGKSDDASYSESSELPRDQRSSPLKSAESGKIKSKERREILEDTESFRFIDESSSSSPRSSKLAGRSRSSVARSRRSSPSKSGEKRETFFNETSEEQNSEDQSAIVAVIESPEWEDEEDDEIVKEIRNAIGEDGERDTELENDDGIGIIRVLPSTSEEETPRNLGIMKRPGTDTLPQVQRKPQVRLTRSQSPQERREKIRQKQRKDSAGRDSGIEPSPRVSRIPRRNLKCYPNTEKQKSINMDTITRDVQISVRRYYLERKIFFQLMELKRLQIRHGKVNEHVLVKRQVDSFNKAGMSGPALGVVKYEKPLTFRDFESFLYEQLRRLQKRPATSDWCTEAKQCTQKTHRCHHATSAYTSVPIYTYLCGDVPERGTSLLPRIESRGRGQMTVEVSHGEEKQVIALPTERLDRSKRYFVTFTVRGENLESEKPKLPNSAQRNTKSV